ncbi:glycerate kinase [Paludibacterium yongneupense]|uniref:glycerate kinase n=1 Tax=Paludibacterium yongneupense TaxID=400061 RepID=UPI00041844EE|nr:glycerate kinase [Paludibacterium yongneupense]
MKIVIAPDSFKESLSAMDVAAQIEAGFRSVYPDADYVSIPMADGGEGTVEAMVAATRGHSVAADVSGPLGDPVRACFGLLPDGGAAVIEMAAASGLELLEPGRRDPLLTSTRGTGELILAALDHGRRHIILGLGGSATNDGGAGMLQALGATLSDSAGHPIGAGGGALAQLARIDLSTLDPRLADCRFDVACDVDNPLLGPLGAAAVFGPQKGADPGSIERLEANLAHYADLIECQLGIDVRRIPGGGAAGGMGAALVAMLGASLRPGIEIVTEAVGLDAAIRDADLVVTGEGRIDSQSVHGKTPIGVARVAKRHGVPVIGIAGSLSSDVSVVHQHGIDAVFSVLFRVCLLEEALAEAAGNIYLTARNIAAVHKIGAWANASNSLQIGAESCRGR